MNWPINDVRDLLFAWQKLFIVQHPPDLWQRAAVNLALEFQLLAFGNFNESVELSGEHWRLFKNCQSEYNLSIASDVGGDARVVVSITWAEVGNIEV